MLIGPLAWGPSYAMGVTLKSKKQQQKNKLQFFPLPCLIFFLWHDHHLTQYVFLCNCHEGKDFCQVFIALSSMLRTVSAQSKCSINICGMKSRSSRGVRKNFASPRKPGSAEAAAVVIVLHANFLEIITLNPRVPGGPIPGL